MVNTIKRTIQSRLEDKFFKGKVIILYGPRQVGKTALVKEIQKRIFLIQYILIVMR